jgi:inorganic pyrophosphatase
MRPPNEELKSTKQDFWSSLATFVSGSSVVLDRPKGSIHPDVPEMIYPLDYGYLTGLRSGDGDGVDVWIGSLKRRVITGVICTVDTARRDAEVKLLLGCTRAEERRILSVHNRGNQRAVLIRAEAAARTAPRRRRPRVSSGRAGSARRR